MKVDDGRWNSLPPPIQWFQEQLNEFYNTREKTQFGEKGFESAGGGGKFGNLIFFAVKGLVADIFRA
jgi:hypothetical protein